MKNKSLVSVIIPVYNRPDLIKKLLISISKQKYKKIETIVIDDASTDDTLKVAKKYSPGVYTRKHLERSTQRNFGANKAKGEFLLFLDSDMELTTNVIADCVKEIKIDKKIGGIVIPEKSVGKTFWEKIKAYERSFYNSAGDQITDAARFFNRAVFEKVGGFDEAIIGPEDWDLAESIKKRGYKIGRIKSEIIHNEQILGLASLIRKKYYYAVNAHKYLKKQNISPFSPKTIYFFRPVFYKNWKKVIFHPVLGMGMFIMFSFELLGGGIGYIVGKYFKK
ncbi:MAG: glycosyltransferase family A protein [Patescibacteria group bacterium]